MFDKHGLPIQKKCAVAYIDLLGITQRIKNDSKWALDWMYLAYSIIQNDIKYLCNIKIKIFSDNILICKEIDENNPGNAVIDVLIAVDKFESLMFKTGALFMRGAVVVGELHFSDNFVCGKALLKAYELESKEAIYPRIIIDKSVVDIINNDYYILVDKDGYLFYDFLQSRIDNAGKRLNQELSIFRANVLLNLRNNINDISTVNKMEWLINYYNEICCENNLRHCITAVDLNNDGINTSDIHIYPKTGGN